MENERYHFLPLDAGGVSILVFGGVDTGLADYLENHFERICIADWNKIRLDKSCNYFRKAVVESISLNVGEIQLPAEQYDQVLVLWVSPYLGNPRQWLDALVNMLKPRGRLVVIELIERQMMQEQQIVVDLIKLRLAAEAASGLELTPGWGPEQLHEYFRSGTLNHVRMRIFTDPDLLYSSEYWRDETRHAFDYTSQVVSRLKPGLRKELQSRAMILQDEIDDKSPKTPPFGMLTGLKRSRRSHFYPQPDDEKTVTEAQVYTSFHDRQLCERDLHEKILRFGPESMKNHELLTVAMGYNSDDNGDFEPNLLVRRIISEYGAKAVAEERDPHNLSEILHIPLAIACQIVAIFSLGQRFYEEPIGSYPVIHSAEDAYIYLRDMGSLRKEHLRGLYLNVQCRLIHDEVISIGILSRSVVHPREVFAPALEYSANAIILAHNHPSGDLTPSENDVTITKQLAQAGRIMGIELLDHLVIGTGGFVSLKKKRIL